MTKDKSAIPHVTIYTDGACIENPGRGGLGAVLIFGQRQKEISCGYRHTTNNRMELMAAITALKALKTPCRVTLYSDSELLVKAMSDGWLEKWRKKSWKRGKKWVLNADLWQQLHELCTLHQVSFHWVKGHAGVVGNERADALSIKASQSSDYKIDVAYEEGKTEFKPPSLF